LDTQISRHRHLVALPVLVAALALSFLGTEVGFPGAISSITHNFGSAEDERFTFDSGIYGTVYAGGQLEEEQNRLVLQKGSALLASKGVIQIDINGASVTAINGAFHLTRGTKSVVVAALTSPVAVQFGDLRMIVPIGMQWEIAEDIATLNDGFEQWMNSRLPKPLPVSFVERKMGDLSIVRVPDSILPDLAQLLPFDIVPEEQLLLQVSQSHVLAGRHEHVLGVVRSAVEAGDVDRFEELLNVPVVTEALETDRGKAVVAVLLSEATDHETVLRMLLLQQLISNEAVWLASSFHPAYRDLSWALFEPDVSVESHLSRVFLLPFSALSAETFSDFVFERFAVSLRGMLSKVGDPDTFGDHIVQVHMPLIDHLEERGYPLRARNLTQILLDLIVDLENPTDVVLQAEDILVRRSRIDLSPLPPKREPEESLSEEPEDPTPDPEPAVTLSPQQVEARAYTLLESVGALFTVNSSIAAYEGNTARVMDILFSTETEDRAVSFSLDVVTKTVSEIQINGNTDFPYTPSLDGFIIWVRK